jgi:hypothetical protein
MAEYVAAITAVVGMVGGANDARRAAKRNAQFQRTTGYEELRATAAHEELQREMSGGDLASQRASLAANGIDSSSGSSLIGTTQSMRDAEMDALMIRYEGVLNARNRFIGAEITQTEGRNAQRQGYLSAAGAALNAYGGYLGRQKKPASSSVAQPFSDPGGPGQGSPIANY